MNDTALTRLHRELGARIVPFAGYNMPLDYTGVRDEHLCVRNALGMFDVSHMGEFWVKGPHAASLIQKLTTNDVHRLFDGKIQYTCFPNGRGGIVDDLLVYRHSEEKYLLVVNASNIDKDWKWLSGHNSEGAVLENASNRMSMVAVQGPLAVQALQKLTSVDLAKMKYYTFEQSPFAGIGKVLISASGYTGAGGFELYVENPEAEKLWHAIMEAGKEFGIKPAGLAARDTLRLEMGFCLYGNDIDESTSPVEAGLGWITKFSEGNLFIDRERLQEQMNKGTARCLAGFTLLEKGIPRQHYDILSPEGEDIGRVTSGTLSPMMNNGIGMGYVSSAYSAPGSKILIRIRNKEIPAEVVSLPIYKKEKP